MKNYIPFLLILMFISWWSCQGPSQPTVQEGDQDALDPVAQSAAIVGNPPAEGFNAAGSDPEAIALADSVMQAHGGRKAWDDTQLIVWNFFGSRKLYWHKPTGQVRIDYTKEDLKIILNEKTGKGRVYKDGAEVSEADTVTKYLGRGKSVWINDSYWLVMPFKLKDSGVTLKYIGQDSTEQGAPAELVELTFENVGDTPDNKYHVWIEQASKQVVQWAYYREASQEEPNFIMPWLDYQKHGQIYLSGNRDKRQITEIAVLEEIPEGLFENFNPPSI